MKKVVEAKPIIYRGCMRKDLQATVARLNRQAQATRNLSERTVLSRTAGAFAGAVEDVARSCNGQGICRAKCTIQGTIHQCGA